MFRKNKLAIITISSLLLSMAGSSLYAQDLKTVASDLHCSLGNLNICGAEGVHLAPSPKAVLLKKIWRIKTKSLNRSSPIFAEGFVYVGDGNGRFHKIEATTGKVVWTRALNEAITASPALDAQAVYVVDDHNQLSAVAKASGQVLWKTRLGQDLGKADLEWDFYKSSPKLYQDLVLLGAGDGTLYALKAKTGKIAWTIKLDGMIRSDIAISDGVLFVGTMQGTVSAYRLANQEKLWSFKTKGNKLFPDGDVQGGISVDHDTVYFGARDGFVYALSKETGQQKWATGHKGSWVISTPTLKGDLVIYGTSDLHTVQALNRKTGELVWKYDADGRVLSSVIGVDGLGYVGLAESSVAILNLETGKAVAYATSEGAIYSTPAVGAGSVFYTSDDGYIYGARP